MTAQHEIQQVLLWVIHLERVAIFVLVAIGAAALALRLVVLRRRTSGPAGDARSEIVGGRGTAIAALSLGAAAASSYMAIRPDTFFLFQMGRDAVARQDASGIITYYEPLVRWNTVGLDVYESLALAYFSDNRPRDGIAMLHRAIAISPTPDDLLICASVHLALGELAEVRAHVEAARPLIQTKEQQAAVDRLAAASTPAVPGR